MPVPEGAYSEASGGGIGGGGEDGAGAGTDGGEVASRPKAQPPVNNAPMYDDLAVMASGAEGMDDALEQPPRRGHACAHHPRLYGCAAAVQASGGCAWLGSCHG